MIGGGEFGAAVDDHDDRVGFVESEAGLAEDFRGNLCIVVGDDAAGIDRRGRCGPASDFAVDAVAGDAGLVADDGAARAGEAIEEGGFADVGASHDRDHWPFGRPSGLPSADLDFAKDLLDCRGIAEFVASIAMGRISVERGFALGGSEGHCRRKGKGGKLYWICGQLGGGHVLRRRGCVLLSGAGACPRRMAFHFAWTLRFVFLTPSRFRLTGFMAHLMP